MQELKTKCTRLEGNDDDDDDYEAQDENISYIEYEIEFASNF
jgi:hypothetical protein